MSFSLVETFKGVLNGAVNSIILNDEVEKVAEERINICRACPLNSENKRKEGENFIRKDEFCTNCGCNLHLKTRYMAASCPLDPPKWEAIVSQEIGNNIDSLINSKENGTQK